MTEQGHASTVIDTSQGYSLQIRLDGTLRISEISRLDVKLDGGDKRRIKNAIAILSDEIAKQLTSGVRAGRRKRMEAKNAS